MNWMGSGSSNDKNQIEFLDILSIISFAIQMNNNEALHRQSTNDDIMRELQTRDKKYFETIIAQNTKIIEELKSLKK